MNFTKNVFALMIPFLCFVLLLGCKKSEGPSYPATYEYSTAEVESTSFMILQDDGFENFTPTGILADFDSILLEEIDFVIEEFPLRKFTILDDSQIRVDELAPGIGPLVDSVFNCTVDGDKVRMFLDAGTYEFFDFEFLDGDRLGVCYWNIYYTYIAPDPWGPSQSPLMIDLYFEDRSDMSVVVDSIRARYTELAPMDTLIVNFSHLVYERQ